VASALKEIANAARNRPRPYKTVLRQGQPHQRLGGARGIGLNQALPNLLPRFRSSLGLPVLTDVHEAPAMRRGGGRSRRACKSPPSYAGRPICCWRRPATGKVVNVKKGQFLAPWGHGERGRQDHLAPATVRCWSPSAAPRSGTTTLGVGHAPRCPSLGTHDRRAGDLRCHSFGAAARRQRNFVGRGTRNSCSVLARAGGRGRPSPACSSKTHPDPDRAPSDGPNMVAATRLSKIWLRTLIGVRCALAKGMGALRMRIGLRPR